MQEKIIEDYAIEIQLIIDGESFELIDSVFNRVKERIGMPVEENQK